MRILLALAALVAAPPALAQLQPAPNTPQYGELLAQQEMLRQQMVQQHNQLLNLEAQMRTQQSLQAIEAQAREPILPVPSAAGHGPYPNIDTGQLASIPDDVLADSNRRAVDASNNRR